MKCFLQAPGLQPPAEERKTDRETNLYATSGKAKGRKIHQNSVGFFAPEKPQIKSSHDGSSTGHFLWVGAGPTVKPMFLDISRYIRTEPFVGSASTPHGLPNLGGRCWMLIRNGVHQEILAWYHFSAARNYNEFDTSCESLGMLPPRQSLPLVATHNPIQLRCRKTRLHQLGRFIRIRCPIALQFKIIDHRPWHVRHREVQHRQSVLRGSWCRPLLVRGNPARNKADLIQAKFPHSQLPHVTMTQVHRVEGSTEKRDFAWLGHRVRSANTARIASPEQWML